MYRFHSPTFHTFWVLTLLWLTPLSSYSASSSANYSISRDVVASGSASSASVSFSIQNVIGQPVTGSTISTNYSLYAGFLSIPDTEGDGILDNVDNCPNDFNPAQLDTDSDGAGNACDLDDDDDGLTDLIEATLGTNPLLTDSDADGLSDFDEVNVDGNPNDYQIGVDSNPNNNDTDGDGLLDGADPFPLIGAPDGDLAPLGAPDGVINAADILIAQRIATGVLTASPLDLAHGDVYPPGAPDGVINVQDLILIRGLVLP